MKTIKEIQGISKKDLEKLYYMVQSELESVRLIMRDVRQESVDLKIDLELHELVSEKLWRLIDDIDTASDMFKPSETNGIKSYKGFYEYVMKKQSDRWKFMITNEKDQNKLIVNPKLCDGENVL